MDKRVLGKIDPSLNDPYAELMDTSSTIFTAILDPKIGFAMNRILETGESPSVRKGSEDEGLTTAETSTGFADTASSPFKQTTQGRALDQYFRSLREPKNIESASLTFNNYIFDHLRLSQGISKHGKVIRWDSADPKSIQSIGRSTDAISETPWDVARTTLGKIIQASETAQSKRNPTRREKLVERISQL